MKHPFVHSFLFQAFDFGVKFVFVELFANGVG
jgi:hypothetical protein